MDILVCFGDNDKQRQENRSVGPCRRWQLWVRRRWGWVWGSFKWIWSSLYKLRSSLYELRGSLRWFLWVRSSHWRGVYRIRGALRWRKLWVLGPM